MTYISLYRKWRPQSFKELVGQDHVAKTLSNAIKNNRIAHAYLFSGPRGTGKTSTAKILAKAINCDNGPSVDPCQKCNNCLTITDGSSLDVLEIDAASNRGIDEIRDLREKAKFVPTGASKKVYIIDEVHMLTQEAFNALLKLLEEPPSHVIFVLATTEPSKVIPTIISRCQRFDFRRIQFPDLIKHLEKVAIKEKIEFEHSAIEIIAKQAQGGLRDALGLLDQLSSYAVKKIKKSDVIDLLGLIGSERLFEAGMIIDEGKTDKIFSISLRLSDEGRDFRQFLKEMVEHFRNIFILQNGGDENVIMATTEDVASLKDAAIKFSKAMVRRLLDIFGDALIDMKQEGDHKLVFELAMLKAMSPGTEESLDAVHQRLDDIERGAVEKGDNDQEKTNAKDLSRQPKKADVSSEQKAAAKNLKEAPSEKSADASIDKSGVTSSTMTKRELERFWPTILAKVKQKSLPVHAILIECVPIEVKDNKLIVGVEQDWQLTLLNKDNNKQTIASAINDILLSDLSVLFKTSAMASPETAHEIEQTITEMEKAEEKNVGETEDKIKMLQDKFGAEIVNEQD